MSPHKLIIKADGEREAKALIGDFARPSHFVQIVSSDLELCDGDGFPFARLIPQILNDKTQSEKLKRATCEMRKVDTPITNRGSIAGKGSMMPRFRKDGSLSDTQEIPPSVRDLLGYGDVIGYLAPSVRTPYFRLSGWTMRHPESLIAILPLANAISDILYNEYADDHDHQAEELVEGLWPTAFSSLNVNVDLRSGYHLDESNQPGSWSALFTDGDYEGGGLVLPGRGICFDIRPGDLLLFKGGEEIHGVLPFKGNQLSGVFFAAGWDEFWTEVALPAPDPKEKTDL